MTGYVADLSWKSGAREIEKLDRLRSTMAVNVLIFFIRLSISISRVLVFQVKSIFDFNFTSIFPPLQAGINIRLFYVYIELLTNCWLPVSRAIVFSNV